MSDAHSASGATAAPIVGWLVESGLAGLDLPGLVAGLGRRLNAAGIVVDRVGCSILTLHPQIVSHEATWRSDGDGAATTHYTPALMEDPENRRGPYFELALNHLTSKRYALGATGSPEEMPLLARLRREGHTEYFGFFHPTGGAAAVTPFASRIGLVPCVVGSFATRRPGGFRDAEIEVFEAVSRPLALAAKARANFETGARLLEIYLGRVSGSEVLAGRITRGDAERISCGIWYCDLRGSSALAARLSPDAYVALLNGYFDASVGAVMQAGGEVLKLIGDAVLGIFRSEDPERDLDMRERALAAAVRALRDIGALQAQAKPLRAGIGLHVGEVMYGNVGTDERLDFTVIGRAVNEAARLQALGKQLGLPLLASNAFAAPMPHRFAFAGAHAVAGLDEKLEAYSARE
jgi:adenylate cyclase